MVNKLVLPSPYVLDDWTLAEGSIPFHKFTKHISTLLVVSKCVLNRLIIILVKLGNQMLEDLFLL